MYVWLVLSIVLTLLSLIPLRWQHRFILIALEGTYRMREDDACTRTKVTLLIVPLAIRVAAFAAPVVWFLLFIPQYGVPLAPGSAQCFEQSRLARVAITLLLGPAIFLMYIPVHEILSRIVETRMKDVRIWQMPWDGVVLGAVGGILYFCVVVLTDTLVSLEAC